MIPDLSVIIMLNGERFVIKTTSAFHVEKNRREYRARFHSKGHVGDHMAGYGRTLDEAFKNLFHRIDLAGQHERAMKLAEGVMWNTK